MPQTRVSDRLLGLLSRGAAGCARCIAEDAENAARKWPPRCQLCASCAARLLHAALRRGARAAQRRCRGERRRLRCTEARLGAALTRASEAGSTRRAAQPALVLFSLAARSDAFCEATYGVKQRRRVSACSKARAWLRRAPKSAAATCACPPHPRRAAGLNNSVALALQASILTCPPAVIWIRNAVATIAEHALRVAHV